MKRLGVLAIIMLMSLGIMISFVLQRSYYKSLCKEELKLRKQLDELIDENKKLSYNLENLTTIQRLVKDSKYRVSLNKVILIEDKK
ncbi:MAG: hypothetical protein ACP5PT_07535 [Brevinematia bacterium]